MTQLQRLTQTPQEIDVAGKKYKLAPLQLVHYAQLEEWAQRQPYAILKGKVDSVSALEIDGKLKKQKISELIDKAEVDSKDPKVIEAAQESTSGFVKQIQLSLSVHHPEVTEDTVRDILKAFSLVELKHAYDRVCTVTDEEAKNE